MRDTELFSPLCRAEVTAAIEGGEQRRTPLARAKWCGEGLVDQYGAPVLLPNPIDPSRMSLSWEWDVTGAHESPVVLDEWSKLDGFIDELPSPEIDPVWEQLAEQADLARHEDRSLMWGFWNLFFERSWMLRGTENLMVDYYVEPDRTRQLPDAMAGRYVRYVDFAATLDTRPGRWSTRGSSTT